MRIVTYRRGLLEVLFHAVENNHCWQHGKEVELHQVLKQCLQVTQKPSGVKRDRCSTPKVPASLR